MPEPSPSHRCRGEPRQTATGYWRSNRPMWLHYMGNCSDFELRYKSNSKLYCFVVWVVMLGGPVLAGFWDKFVVEFPDHPIGACFEAGLNKASVVPINLHGDGGRCYRKAEIMILQWQSAIGQGTRFSNAKRKLETRDDAQINLAGHSLSTRFLMSTMCKKYYDQDPAPLLELLGHVSDWFGSLFDEGIWVGGTCYKFLPVGLKGDLVFQSKAGGLLRAFTHVRKRRPTAKSKPLAGICWLCQAGTPQVDFSKLPEALTSTLKASPTSSTTQVRLCRKVSYKASCNFTPGILEFDAVVWVFYVPLQP